MVSLRSLVAGAALMAAPIMAALTPAQIVDGTNSLTEKSRALLGPAESINLVNSPLIVIGQGPFPTLITGFVDIITTATAMIGMQEGTAPITDAADSDNVFNAFREFVRVHQQLLNILIGRAGLLQSVPVIGGPMASVLRQVEGVVDAIAFFLIDTVESRSDDLGSEAQSLSGTIQTCIQKYERLPLKKRSGGATLDAVRPDARVFVA